MLHNNQYENIQNNFVNESNSSKQLIKCEKIKIYEMIIFIFILALISIVPTNIILKWCNVNLSIYILVNFTCSPIFIYMLFIPIGINLQFDYINKGIMIYKRYILSCINDCFKNKHIPFNEIKNFKIQNFNFVFLEHYNFGYYDINQKFQILISFPYTPCFTNLNELNNTIEKLNQWLNEEHI